MKGYTVLYFISSVSLRIVNMTQVDRGVLIIGSAEEEVAKNKKTRGEHHQLQRHLIVFSFILLLGCVIVYGYYSAIMLQKKVNNLHSVVEDISTSLGRLGVSKDSQEQLFSLLKDIAKVRNMVNATFGVQNVSIPVGLTNASRIINGSGKVEKAGKNVITLRVVARVHLLTNNVEWFVAAIQNFSKNLQPRPVSADVKLPDEKAHDSTKNKTSQSSDDKIVNIRNQSSSATTYDVSKSATSAPNLAQSTGSITSTAKTGTMQNNITPLPDSSWRNSSVNQEGTGK